jgi:pimeloyl-ACP methyl ester carboxylesterase
MTDVQSLNAPGRTVVLPGRGEAFIRDTGNLDAPLGTVVLLHGWMFGADFNWITAWQPLREAGYRAVAPDHRGHGRGIRSLEPFRLVDCADDAAELIRQLDVEPVLLHGYSMGGAIAQLLAHRNPELVRGVVLAATSAQWREERRMRIAWRTMRALQFALTHYNRAFWKRAMRNEGMVLGEDLTNWMISELMRSDPRAIAEAGREMARFDSRPWLAEIEVPIDVICPKRDHLVPPAFQRELAAAIPGARLFEVPGDHLAIGKEPQAFMEALLEALADVSQRSAAPAAVRAEAG